MKTQSEAIEQSALKIYRKKLQNGEHPAPPYRATKYHSPRTLFKASRMLRAFVVRDWIEKGGKRSLTSSVEDLRALKSFFVLSGPNEQFTQSLLERTVNPYERSQLSAIQQESNLFDEAFSEIAREMNEVVYKYALVELDSEVHEANESGKKEQMVDKLSQLWFEANEHSFEIEQAHQTGKEIGYALVSEFLESKIRALDSRAFETTIAAKKVEAEERKARLLEEMRQAAMREAAAKKQKEMEERMAKVAAERKARIDAYMSSQQLNAFKEPEKYFELVAETAAVGDPPFVPGSPNRNQFHINVGGQSLVFAPGEKGFRIRANGSVESFAYETALPDQMLRELLVAPGDRSLIAIDDTQFAVQRGAILAVVDAATLKLKRFQMLNSQDYFAFSSDGRTGYEINIRKNTVQKIDVLTGGLQTFNINNLNGYQGHLKDHDFIWATTNPDQLNMSYNNCTGAGTISLSAGAVTGSGVTMINVPPTVSNLVAGKFAICAGVNGHYFLFAYADLVNPSKSASKNIPNFNVGNVAQTSINISPDSSLVSVTGMGRSAFNIVEVQSGQVLSVDFKISANTESISWIDAQHIVYKGRSPDGRTIYRIYRIKPPSASELEAIASGATN